jgi:hypothetical protein
MAVGPQVARLRVRLLLLLATTAFTVAIAATPALAADPSCRASALRVLSAGAGPAAAVEPVRANAAGTPCTAQSASALAPTSFSGVSADALSAETAITAGPTLGAAASATLPVVTVGGLTVGVQEARASVLARCDDGVTQFAGSSRVTGLVVNGQSVTLPRNDEPFTQDLGPLGVVRANERVEAGGVHTRRALVIDTPTTDVVIAEAIAGGDACAAGEGGTGSGSGEGRVCPLGSTYDASRALCLIRAGAQGGGAEIIVGRPFESASGGRVMRLDLARERYRSACLQGRGPDFAVIGTRGRDRVTGSNRADRILTLSGNDSVGGGRGNDCIDGGTGADALSGSVGADRLIGGSGKDALNGGSSTDRLSGGAGRDTINTGFGRDRVTGGSGSDAINASTAGPASRSISCGSGRDKLRINRNERRRHRGCEIVYRIR